MSNSSWIDDLLDNLAHPHIDLGLDFAWSGSRQVVMHQHDCYQLEYFYKGDGLIVIGEDRYQVNPGDLFIINPGIEHYLQSSEEQPLEGITFKFELHHEGRTPRFPGLVANLSSLSTVQRRELENHLRNVCAAANYSRIGNKQLAASLMCVFFVLLARYLRELEQITDVFDNASQCKRIAEYIDLNYASRITLEDLSEMAGWRPQYLCKQFAKEMGTSPISYLVDKRIEAAKTLLRSTRLPVSEVGFRAGFVDAYNFSKRFKSKVGVSPKSFRTREHIK